MSNSPNINVQPLFTTPGPVEGDKAKADGVWMSVQEASNATGLSMGTLRRYIKSGKIKFRRRGRTDRSKLEVLVTQAFLPDQAGQGEYFGTDEEADDDEDFQEVDLVDQLDHADQSSQPDHSMQATMEWLRKKLDEKDALLKEKDSKIDVLAHELAGAHYRNGYLESEKNNFEQKLLLLEDRSRATVIESDHIEATEVKSQPSFVVESDNIKTTEAATTPSGEKPAGAWTKISKWLTGQ